MVTKHANYRSRRVGQPLSYTVVVSNVGPAAAANVAVTDALSAPVRLASVTTTAGSCRRALPMGCSLGAIASGGKVTLRFVVVPKLSGTLANSASATGDGLDPTTANNLVVVKTEVVAAKPALSLTKAASPRSVRSGGRVSFRITVRSIGPVTAKKVRVCDSLPSPLRPVKTSGWKQSGGKLCRTVASLRPGKKRVYTLVASVPYVGHSHTITITNTAHATGPNLKRVTAHAKVRLLAVVTPPRFTGRRSAP